MAIHSDYEQQTKFTVFLLDQVGAGLANFTGPELGFFFPGCFMVAIWEPCHVYIYSVILNGIMMFFGFLKTFSPEVIEKEDSTVQIQTYCIYVNDRLGKRAMGEYRRNNGNRNSRSLRNCL